jgi:hypothetical protein
MTDEVTEEPTLDGDAELERVTKETGIDREVAEKILQAQLDLLMACGIATPDDEGRGAALRDKYPELLGDARLTGARDSPLTFEVEATIAQRESGAKMQDVVEVIARSDVTQMIGNVDEYRAWAEDWIE